MSIAQRTVFSLERFTWREPDRIEVVGTWRGVPDQWLADPVLVVRARGSEVRLEAAGESDGERVRRAYWNAAFSWSEDPQLIEAATLELGGALAVDLPSLTSARRRFGRVLLDVRRTTPPSPPVPSPSEEPPARPLELHAALVSAREEAEAARAEAQEAREAMRRAQQDAGRERERGKAESARMREALATMEGLARQALAEEQEATEALRAELDEATQSLEALRARDAEYGQHEHELRSALREAREEVSGLQTRNEALRSQLTETLRAAQARASDQGRAIEQAQRDVRMALTESHERELSVLQEQLDAAAAELEQRDHAVKERLDAAAAELAQRDRAHRERLDAAAAELEQRDHAHREQFETAAAELEQRDHAIQELREALADVREQLGDLPAVRDEMEKLRASLDEAEHAARWHHARAERLEATLAAVRDALSDQPA